MTAVAAGMAAVLAWVGVCLVMLSDGRRGLGVGLLMAGLGLAGVRFFEADAPGAGVLATATLLAVFLGWRRSPRKSWGTLPPQSTPRVIACGVLGAFALWLARAGLTAPGAWQDRGAIAALIAVAAARLLTVDDPLVALAAASAVALAAGTLASIALPGGGLTAVAVGAVVAVGLNLVPVEDSKPAPRHG